MSMVQLGAKGLAVSLRPLLRVGLAVQIALAPIAASAQPASESASDVAARIIAEARAPDSIGTGSFPARKGTYPSLPNQVVYQPADLDRLGELKMPIYVFGNGACSEDGASSRQHLLEIASHGYLAVAPGGIFSGPGVEMTPESLEAHRGKTRYQQLGEAIDWAIAQNGDPDSPFHGRIATDKIAVSGFSCGGIQAIRHAGDARVSTVVMMNTGILMADMPDPTGQMTSDKRLLDAVHTPVLYVLGGKSDIAYANGMDDYARLRSVPVAVINTDVGHGGTYSEPNGGRAAQAVVAWLQWHLRGDQAAAKWFVGDDCVLCRDPLWTIESRNLDAHAH